MAPTDSSRTLRVLGWIEDRLTGDVDAHVLRCSAGFADQSYYFAGVEDAIKITRPCPRWKVEQNKGSIAY